MTAWQPRIDPSQFGAQAARFLAIHRDADTQRLVRNVGAAVVTLDTDGLALPCTVNLEDAGDAWICSPRTSYCDYAAEELQRLGKPSLTAMLSPLLRAVAAGMRGTRLDACVAVNNWLLSTNAYPDLPAPSIGRIVDAARTRWPDRTLWFRSLNVEQTPQWIAALRDAGATLVPSRQVYLYRDIATLRSRHADMRRDLALQRRRGVQPLGTDALSQADYARIAELYALLYLGKYSRLNPDYTPALVQAWHRAGLLELHGIRGSEDILSGVVGMFRFGDLITAPVVGYDTSRPRREGLFRLLMSTVFRTALEHDCLVNLSAGVPHFKRQRGGLPAIEYSAVVAGHLPVHRRAAVGALGLLTRYVGVPIMRRYEL